MVWYVIGDGGGLVLLVFMWGEDKFWFMKDEIVVC